MPETVPIDFPLPGVCVTKRPPGHHPLALDLMGLDGPQGHTRTTGALSWLAGAAKASDYHGWGRPVHSPGAGTVLAAVDTQTDHARTGAVATAAIWLNATIVLPRLVKNRPDFDIAPNVGNHVMIRTAPGQVVFYAHLRHGTTGVAVGEHVKPGEEIAELGNSGNSTAPHLHVHVLDQADDLTTAQLLPFHFIQYERWTDNTWERQANALPEPGEIVRPVND